MNTDTTWEQNKFESLMKRRAECVKRLTGLEDIRAQAWNARLCTPPVVHIGLTAGNTLLQLPTEVWEKLVSGYVAELEAEVHEIDRKFRLAHETVENEPNPKVTEKPSI